MNNETNITKKIVLTGGGTAGHVTPNIALLPMLKENNFDIYYIGSHNGIEKELIEKEGLDYYGISSGKLRRYLDFKNVTDIGRILKGVNDARKILKQLKPDVIFSKGGFVTVPVVIAADFLKIPVVIHESDLTPGLANKISMRFAKKICCTFPETLNYLPKNKGELTGTPIRQELFIGNKENAMKLCNFTDEKPIILIMGGSQGSKVINDVIHNSLSTLLLEFNIIHLCGKGNVNNAIQENGYKQFEYVGEELKDLLAVSSIMISRAGANAISEFLALRKPCLLIPLSKNASRGDQILNANSFSKQGFAKVLQEEDITEENFINNVKEVYINKDKYIKSMKKSPVSDSIKNVVDILLNVIRK